MALAETLYGVKAATVDIIHEVLNEGLEPGSPERVDVFYGWSQADTPNRMVVVAGGGISGWDGEGRMYAGSSLRRYGLDYQFEIQVATNVAARTEEDGEREDYQLFDRLLTPIMRGDANGHSLLCQRVPAVQQVTPISDQWASLTTEDGRAFAVLTFTLSVELIRD